MTLKARLSSLAILVMALKFVEKVFEVKEPLELLFQGLAIAIVVRRLDCLQPTSEARNDLLLPLMTCNTSRPVSTS